MAYFKHEVSIYMVNHKQLPYCILYILLDGALPGGTHTQGSINEEPLNGHHALYSGHRVNRPKLLCRVKSWPGEGTSQTKNL